MTRKRVLTLLVAMVFLFSLPAVASAQETPPHIFIGKVFDVSGGIISVGTVVTAYINGVAEGSTTVTAGGAYTLMVSRGAGTNITFRIGNLDATETFTWQLGDATVLDLNAGTAVQPIPIPSIQGLPGPVGPEGPPGAPGPTGETGSAGPPGQAGLKGDTGQAGSDGSTGSAGSPGAVGPAGSTGGTIFSIIALILSAVAVSLAVFVAFLKR